jgi:TATA-box binding protein (TBP) (component of TFIID and TFIIIB)
MSESFIRLVRNSAESVSDVPPSDTFAGQNMVVTFGAGNSMSPQVVIATGTAERNPKRFPASFQRIHTPGGRATGLYYGTGKAVNTGTKVWNQSYLSAKMMTATQSAIRVRHGGTRLTPHTPRVRNRVFRASRPGYLDLAKFWYENQNDTEYEPEKFPGARHVVRDAAQRPIGMVNVMDTFRMNIVGAVTHEQVRWIIDDMTRLLERYRTDVVVPPKERQQYRIDRKRELMKKTTSVIADTGRIIKPSSKDNRLQNAIKAVAVCETDAIEACKSADIQSRTRKRSPSSSSSASSVAIDSQPVVVYTTTNTAKRIRRR